MHPTYNHAALEALIERSGVSHRKNARSYIFDCPRCKRSDRLYIRRSPPDGRFTCFYCGERDNFRGRPEYALAELLGKPIGELRALLYEGYKEWEEAQPLRVELKPPPWDSDAEPLDEFQGLPERPWPPDFVPPDHPAFAKAREYLQSRGISDLFISLYDIRFHPKTQRVIFPVVVSGRLLGWQGRYIHATEGTTEEGEDWKVLKILSTPGLSGGQVVMFQDRLIGSPHAVICEGPVDAIKATQCGGNIATMGKSIGTPKLKTILNYGIKKVYLALDRDAARETLAACRFFHNEGVQVHRLLPPYHQSDLGECTPAEVYEAFKKAPVITPSHVMTYLAPLDEINRRAYEPVLKPWKGGT